MPVPATDSRCVVALSALKPRRARARVSVAVMADNAVAVVGGVGVGRTVGTGVGEGIGAGPVTDCMKPSDTLGLVFASPV